jgi:diguanylate cyclase (GGDEF)-like protein
MQSSTVWIDAYGPPEVLRYGPVPLQPLSPGDVRIRTLFAAVNHTDLEIRAGNWPVRKAAPFPYVPGVEVVGLVEEAGTAGAVRRARASRVAIGDSQAKAQQVLHGMPTHLSATDIAFAMIAVMQVVFCGIWLLGSWVIGDVRRAALHWSAFAGLSTLSFVALIVALHQPVPLPAEYLRALGNVLGVIAMLALHRGIRLFVGARPLTNAYTLALVVVLVASWLGLSPTHSVVRVSVNSTVLAVIALGIAADLYRYGRNVVRRRHTWLLSVPLVAAAVGFSLRGVRAMWHPQSVTTEMIADSALNVGSAIAYMVIALTFHATLIGLVFGRLLTDLRHRSRHDGLTGLLNRRTMEETLLAQVQRSRRTGEPFTVLMLDLDHFKEINDRHGHATGDRALKHTAAALKAQLREVDALGRFGGEEFLVLMPGATVEAARPAAERLRAALVTDAPRIEGATLSLSASIGIAQWRGPAEEPSRLLMRADAALYRAKMRGRDCVVVEAPEIEAMPDLADNR